MRGVHQPWLTDSVDIENEPRTNSTVDVGADEYWGNSLTGGLSIAILVSYTQAVAGLALPFEASITGHVQGYVWDLGDGITVTNLCQVTHAYAHSGSFPVTLTASNLSGSAATTVTVSIVSEANYYVATNGNDLATGTTGPPPRRPSKRQLIGHSWRDRMGKQWTLCHWRSDETSGRLQD